MRYFLESALNSHSLSALSRCERKVKRTCFGPADGGVVPAFSRALDGDVVIELQALSRLGGRGELQLLWNTSQNSTHASHTRGKTAEHTLRPLLCQLGRADEMTQI